MENILITYLSRLPNENTDIVYSADTADTAVTARYTNEVALRHLKNCFRTSGEKLDKVIAVCSGVVKTYKSQSFGEKTAFEYFSDVLKTEFEDAELVVVDGKGRYEGSNDIANVFEAIKSIPSDSNIYLDITGGFRDSVYTLTLISRFLEFKGINVKRVIYAMITEKPKGKITDYTSNFGLMSLINGVSEFVNFGNVKTLEKCFADTKREDVRMLIGSMKSFSDAITLGKTDMLDSILRTMREHIQSIESAPDGDVAQLLLNNMVPIINQKFFGGSDDADYISIIQWCIDNGLIQQALTLYVEKIPEYIFKKGIIKCSEEVEERNEKKKQAHENLYAKIFYSDFMEGAALDDISTLKGLVQGINAKVMNPKTCTKDKKMKKAVSNYMEIYEEVRGKSLRKISADSGKMKAKPTNADVEAAWEVLMKNSYDKIEDITANDFFKALLGGSVQTSNTTEKKIHFIESFEDSNPSGYTYGADKRTIKNITAAYAFFKAVRNEINHASDNENLTDTQKKFFEKLGYKYEMSVDTLARELNNAIEIIKAAQHN